MLYSLLVGDCPWMWHSQSNVTLFSHRDLAKNWAEQTRSLPCSWGHTHSCFDKISLHNGNFKV